jgi:pantetheine-phosphate adenylyltransferase
MRRAVYAGSFDPITLGHPWMIEQGAGLFDERIVAIGVNPEKRYRFSLEERLQMLRQVAGHLANVRVASFENCFWFSQN